MRTHAWTIAAAVVCLAAGASPIRAQNQKLPDVDEPGIARWIDAHNGEALSLLERAVNINSGTDNLAGVRQVGALFKAEFDALGFKTTWVDGAPFGRAGHLIATHSSAGPKILLIGHLDTVFPADSAFQKFERLDANTAKGPGIIDMKGGDVIIVQALKALNAAGALPAMNVVVVMTGDEEDTGRPLTRARAALTEAATGASVALGFEDGDGNPSHAVVARRGTTGWILTTTGTPAHSSQIFQQEVGAGAVFEAARILDAFRTKLAGQAHLTFNPGVLLGGTSVDFNKTQARGTAFGKTNVVAEHATVAGDLRALTPDQFAQAKTTMQAIVAESLPRTKAEIVFDEGYPPLAPSPGNTELLALYDTVSRSLGLGAVEAVSPDKAGAADVSFVADKVSMIIDAIGLKGHDDHTPGETADLSTLPVQTKRAAVTLVRLAGGAKK